MAATVTWDGSGDSNWSQPDSTSWSGATYDAGDDAVFGNIGVGTNNIIGLITPGHIIFQHTSGLYVFTNLAGNIIAGAGNLTLSGGGTAQFGNLANNPSGLGALITWGGATFISGGSTLALTRPGSLGGAGSEITIDNGTLRLGADNSASFFTSNNIAVAAGGAAIIGQFTGNQTHLVLAGNFSGAGPLILRASGTAGNLGNAGVLLSGANANYSGPARIDSVNMTNPVPASLRPTAVWFANAGAWLSGASSVAVRDGGVLGVEFPVALSNLANVRFEARGGLGARGASGTLTNLADPLAHIGKGGFLVLDNFAGVANRLGDGAPLNFAGHRLDIIGRNANNTPVNEQAGALRFSGGNHLYLNRRNTSSGVVLTVSELAAASAGDTLLLETGTSELGEAATNSALAILEGGPRPAAQSGIISPGIQHFSGGNSLGTFLGYGSVDPNRLVAATYNVYAGDWGGAAPDEVVDVNSANQTITGAGDLDIYALRVSGGDQNLNGRKVNLESGGLILSSRTISNGGLDFGEKPAFIGAYNAAAQASLNVNVAGSGGVTVMGTSQSLNLNNSNSFTGGLYINGGTVQLGNINAANSNDVTVNAFGRLAVNVGTAALPARIGGLSGEGNVTGGWQSAGTNYLAFGPASGVFTFNGRLANGDGGKVLHLIKTGAGTQIFGAESLGAYRGTLLVTNGTLVINGNFGLATNLCTVASGATLGGSGIMGGSASYGAGSGALFYKATGAADTPLRVSGSLALPEDLAVTVEVSGAPLTSGTYALATAAVITGAVTNAPVITGAGLAPAHEASVAVNGSTLVLTVVDSGVVLVPTVVALHSSANPALLGSTIDFSASVLTNGVLAADATGSVIFKSGTTPLSTNALSGGVAVFSMSGLTAGVHSITAQYTGDAAYAPSVSTGLAQVVNTPPSAANQTLGTSANQPVAMSLERLLQGSSDADGDPLSVSSVSASSTSGGVVMLTGTNVLYTPPANFVGADTFTYTLSDGRGGAATGTVFVTVSNGLTFNIVGAVYDGGAGTFTITFAGVPGYVYRVQQTEALTPPVVWTDLSTNSAPSHGVFQYVDQVGTSTNRFYRAVNP